MKKEYLILAVIILVLSLYLVFHQSGEVHYQLPSIEKVTQKSITKVEITKGKDQIVLKRQGGQWLINAAAYPADTDTVNRMLDILDDLTVTALASESGNYERYELDEKNRIHVKAYQDDRLIRNFSIGKTAPSFNHTFVRLKNSPNVYHAQNNFRSRFDQTVDALRDKSILKFQAEDIQGVEIKKGKTSLAFAKTAPPVKVTTAKKAKEKASAVDAQPVWQDRSGKEIKGGTIHRFLSALSTLRCSRYAVGKTREQLKDPLFIITLKGPETSSLSLFAADDKDAEDYLGVSSQNNYVFMVPKSRIDSLMEPLDPKKEKQKAK